MATHTLRPASHYLIDYVDPYWQAYYVRPETGLTPVRFDNWEMRAPKDNIISDDVFDLFRLAHCIIADAARDSRSYDELFPVPEAPALWHRFREEMILPTKSVVRPRRMSLPREAVLAWLEAQSPTPYRRGPGACGWRRHSN